MSVFKDENEVYTYIGKVFEMAVTDPVFVEATKDSGLVVKLTQTDPAATILIDFPGQKVTCGEAAQTGAATVDLRMTSDDSHKFWLRSEEHTSELQSRLHLVCRLLLEKKNNQKNLDLNPCFHRHLVGLEDDGCVLPGVSDSALTGPRLLRYYRRPLRHSDRVQP